MSATSFQLAENARIGDQSDFLVANLSGACAGGVVVVSLWCALLRWVLELVALCARSKEGPGTRNHRPAARTRDPSANYAPSGYYRRRPAVASRCQPTFAANALAILHRHAGDVAALASTPGREAVDVTAVPSVARRSGVKFET
jgi:hypothetical protein